MTLQSPTATLIPLFSSSELTGCGYPGLLDRKNRSDLCPRWESNPRLPSCKASTLSTRPGSPLRRTRGVISQNLYIVVGLSVAYYANRKIILFFNIIAHSLKPHPRKMPHATRRISSACFDVYDAFTSAYTILSVIHSIAVKSEQK